MGLRISKSNLYQALLVLCVAVPYFNNYELTFLVWITAAAVTLTRRYSIFFLKQAACYAAIVLIACLSAVGKDYSPYFMIRDITYLIKPVVGLFVGYQLCKYNFRTAFNSLILAGVVVASWHYIVLGVGFLYFHAFTVNDIRFYAGYFSDYEVYVLIFLLFRKQFGIEMSDRRAWFLIAFVGLSVFAYLARTNFIQFVLLYVGMKGYYAVNKRSIAIVSGIILATIIGYSAILYINPKRNGQGLEAFLYKIKVAPIEPFKTKVKRDDWKDFNDNYRSYENIHTLRQVNTRSEIMFGKGIGSQIDLKQRVWLGDMELRFISILHNGFMTVYLKSGLLGLGFFIISIYLLFKKRRPQIPIIKETNKLLLSSGIFMIVSAWVFMGYYFIADTKSLLIGFLICYQEIARKEFIAHD